jgi:hypothetical protein
MRNSFYFLFFLFSFTSNSLSAQNISVRGRVLDGKEQTFLSFANIALYQDSGYITGISTDTIGKFAIEHIKPGNYMLTVSYLGYKTERIRIDELSKSIDIGDIVMESSTQELKEVVVSAGSVITKIDRQIILPTNYQIKISNNAFDLLNSMMISRLHVDPIFKTITVSGGENVQTRINGIKASKEEVATLRAKDIQRIEYIDSPGAQYRNENVEAVINIIVKRKESGGIVAIDGLNAPFIRFGENNVSAKYNYKQSEWSLIYELSYRKAKERWRDLTESFYYPDGNELIRKQEGIIAPLQNNTHVLNLSYNLFKPDKYIFNAIVKDYFYRSPEDNWASVISSQGSERISIQTYQSEKQQKPSLDLYFQYMLPKNQSLSINMVGTYSNTLYERTYGEFSAKDTLTHIFTEVEGKKYAIVTEGVYERFLGKQKFNAGMKYTQIKSENQYNGSEFASTKMDQSEYYIFADLTGKLTDKWRYMLGSGLSRSWFLESEHDRLFYTFCPIFQLSYTIKEGQNMRYRFSLKPSIPSLSSLSNVEQAIDSLQFTKGNPDLQPFKIYRNTMSYTFSKKKLNAELFASYLYYDKPIMEDVFIRNNRFIIMENNQVNWQKINIEATLGFAPLDIGNLRNFASFSLSGGFSRFLSNGNQYLHHYNNFYYNAAATFLYKNWILLGEFRTFQSNLYGERIKYGENQQSLMLLFRPDKFTFGLGILFPFSSTFKEGYERFNKIVPVESWTYVNESSRMIIAKISYDFSLGRKYKIGRKHLNNQDDSDSGILKSDR